MPEPKTEPWHLTKSVPIALILAIAGQSGAAVWWVSKMESRVEEIARSNAQQDDDISAVQVDVQRMAVSAATVNAQLQAVRDSLSEVKATQRETQELVRGIAEKLK